MKIEWNKLARGQWHGFYKGHNARIKFIGDAGYQYLIWDEKGKLIHDGIEKRWRKAIRTVKKLLKDKTIKAQKQK